MLNFDLHIYIYWGLARRKVVFFFMCIHEEVVFREKTIEKRRRKRNILSKRKLNPAQKLLRTHVQSRVVIVARNLIFILGFSFFSFLFFLFFFFFFFIASYSPGVARIWPRVHDCGLWLLTPNNTELARNVYELTPM